MTTNELLKRIKYYDPFYDKRENLLFMQIYDINSVHSSLKNGAYVHNLNSSLQYAELLLEYSGKSGRANDIIKKVISLQQSNPFEEYYGLWPLYTEEPIKDVPNPDLNQAVFLIDKLLYLYKNYSDVLPMDTLSMMKSASFAAATFIVNRNTTLQYSHIVISECYACVLCGELFSRHEFINYGMQKLEKFLNFVSFNGDYFEFNSPIYSFIMAKDLSSVLRNITNSRVLDAANKLNKILWRSIASHYHYTTGQLSGPFSRTKTDFLPQYIKETIYKATGKNVLYTNDAISNFLTAKYEDFSCPPQYYPFFTGEKNIEYSQRLITHGSTYPNFTYAHTATTYILPKYTLGTFNRQEFWEEHRPLIGYFGCESSPFCFKLTCLLDSVPFSSSQLHCVQVKNSVLGHICLTTNHGLHHMDDNKLKNGVVELSDLRIQFTILGNISELSSKINGDGISVFYDGLLINFIYNFYEFDKMTPHVEFSKSENSINFDLVIFSGKKRKLDISELECAICQFALHISEKGNACTPVSNTVKDGQLTSVQCYENFELFVQSPIAPMNWILLMMQNSQKINGIKLEDYARDTEESALQYEFIVNSSSKIPISVSKDSNLPIDNILSRIENIVSLDFDSIHAECKEILDILRSNNISLDMAKRFSIRILTNIFEMAKSYSIIFDKIIKYEYSNIYISLSQDNSIDAIEKTIMNILDKIQLDYQLYSENEKRKKFVDSITELINMNFSDTNLSLTYISDKLGLSESYIGKNFKKRTGMNYLQYLTQVRMEHAKKMISSGETNYTTLAADCGYENVTSFLRAFKKYTGTTVSAYIKKNKINYLIEK